MADISVQKSHDLPPDQAREAVEKVAERLAGQYQLKTEWKGDDLTFKRSGAKGRVHLGAREVLVELDLGLLLKPLKGTIRGEIERYLERFFESKA